ncbi:MAG: glycosyltransferase [Sphingobium sp.]|nr:glycosyltransferase [Sphingobium sp.]
MPINTRRSARISVIGLRGIPDVLGGIETHCENLYPALIRDNPDLDITIFVRKSHTVTITNEYKGVKIRAVAAPQIFGVDALLHSLWCLLICAFSTRPDIVHIHGIGPAFFTPLARMLGLKTIITHHAQDYLRPKWGWKGRLFLRWGERMAALFANHIICVSAALERDFLKIYPSAARKTHIIRNAPSSIAGRQKPDNDVLKRLNLTPGRYILAAGRLEATKNYLFLMDAFKRAGLDDMKLVIAGTFVDSRPDYEEKLKKQVSENIILPGYQQSEKLTQLYKNAALFVHPSHMEGYGLVIAEALAAGLPVIASNLPVHREFLLPEKCLFDPDTINELVSMLKRPDYSYFLHPVAISAQKNDHWHRAGKEHMRIYRNLLPNSAILTPTTR